MHFGCDVVTTNLSTTKNQIDQTAYQKEPDFHGWLYSGAEPVKDSC